MTVVTVGESEGCVDMGHMMEDEEVEDTVIRELALHPMEV